MATQSEWNELFSTMSHLRGFVEERFNPVESKVDLLSDEQKRLSDEVEKWLRKSEQGDKWNRCLIEGMIVLWETGARDEQTTPP